MRKHNDESLTHFIQHDVFTFHPYCCKWKDVVLWLLMGTSVSFISLLLYIVLQRIWVQLSLWNADFFSFKWVSKSRIVGSQGGLILVVVLFLFLRNLRIILYIGSLISFPTKSVWGLTFFYMLTRIQQLLYFIFW